MTTEPKSVFIKTFGCQMNVYDSERMKAALATDGYVETEVAEEASLVLFNTCHIREHAAEKVYSELGKFRTVKKERQAQGKDMVVAVAGCVAQAEGSEILRRSKTVDLVIGPQAYHRLPELVARKRFSAHPIVETEFPAEDKFAVLEQRAPRLARGAVTAFLTVQEGCDKFCTFCVVPYTRGAEYSRGPAQILAEAAGLVAQGVREITLLGQNVNAYHGKDEQDHSLSLAKLIDRLSTLKGLERIRYTTSHPLDMSDDLLVAHRDNPKLMPYLHLPVQSGSDRILRAMNRNHSSADYIHLVERLRGIRPDIALSGDFIVGFPGETEEDFNQTLTLIRNVGYASAYAFRYSARPGTPAALMTEQLSYEVAAARLQQVLALLQEQQTAFNTAQIGKTLPVLIERQGRHDGQMGGRSPYLQSVHISGGTAAVGETRRVRIVGASSNSLSGTFESL